MSNKLTDTEIQKAVYCMHKVDYNDISLHKVRDMLSFTNKILRDFRSHFILLAAFFILAVFSFLLMRSSIIANTKRLGNEIVHYYAMEEEKTFLSYKRFIERVAVIMNESRNMPDREQWLEKVFRALQESSKDDGNIKPYAVINKKIIACSPGEASGLDFSKAKWYNDALNADGKIIFTPIYADSSITHKSTITIAKKVNADNEVVAIDIYADKYAHPTRSKLLPDGSSYYLYDSAGNVFFYESSLGLSKEQIKKHASELFIFISKSKNSFFKIIFDPHGNQKFLYNAKTADGLTAIVTIPYSSLLEKLHNLLYVTLAILILLNIFIGFYIHKEYKANKRYEKITETVSFLGNIYYAIYLIDLENNNFTPIKESNDTKQFTVHAKSYQDFIQTVTRYMEENVTEEFISAFSINNLRTLSAQGIKEFGGDFKRLFPNGSEWVAARIFFDNISNTKSAILCLRKVTEEKEAQMKQYELLVTAVKNAKSSEKARNEFFSNMSHDMRTPLNGILGYTELGLNHAQTLAETREYLNKIKYSSNQLLELINHILELSRAEHKKYANEQAKINLPETIEACMQPFYAMAITQGKNFRVQYDIQNPYVYAHTFELTQILNNIISNAFKYSVKYDNITVKVRQLDSGSSAKYQILVEDTGKGMTKEFLKKIFIPYQREILFGAKEILGTGLGMPIVKNIITSLNGEISIDSELGKGTKVTVILPFAVAEEQKQNKEAPQTKQKTDLDGLRILLAEDNQINMEIAYKLLTAQNVLADKAWNGLEAVSFFTHSTENYYDLILMDLQMPKLDGLEAARQIRSLDRKDAKTVPIIAVSANAFAEDIANCLQAGMNDHIAKPFQPQKLYELIYSYTKGAAGKKDNKAI